ncbi:MAG: hypothetical protein ACRD2B_17950 [Terriglobia bacterium]
MDFKEKLLDRDQPMTLFEMVPPAAGNPEAVENVIQQAGRALRLADAINLPEIHDESRGEPRAAKFVERVEPRVLGNRIRQQLGMDVVVNRCVVYEADPIPWFRKTVGEFGFQQVVIVGGESSRTSYPGPSVLDAARRLQAAGLNTTLGGISIPSRVREAERIRRKAQAGLTFFTTQVLFDANDIVWLLQRLNGLEARIFLSFAPVSHRRDLDFLRWLGVDIPQDLDHFVLRESEDGQASQAVEGNGSCLDRSLDLFQRILMDVFDNLPPDPPPIGLNIEHINKRNFGPAIQMLEKLGALYNHLISARASLA